MDSEKMSVPFIVHEAALARLERQLKRLWIALIVAILLLFATNAMWLYVIVQYDYVTETTTDSYNVDLTSSDGGNANYIGGDGDITDGTN